MSKSNSSFNIIIKESKTPTKNNDELSIGNTTNHDSLHNTKKSLMKSFKTENKVNGKRNNFFMALQTLKTSIDTIKENDIFEGMEEYSETNPNQTKEENISRNLHRPLVKEIIKEGNYLNIIKPITNFGISINNPYIFNYNLENIIDKFKIENKNNKKLDDIKNKGINNLITINTTSVNKFKYKKIFNGQVNKAILNDKLANKFNGGKNQKFKFNTFNSTNIKPFHKEKIIDDLEKPIDIKVKDYENKLNIIKNNQKLDKNISNKVKDYRDNLKDIVKNLNFQDISNSKTSKEKIKQSINNGKNSNGMNKIKKLLLSYKNTSTGEKIRMKYERSELKAIKNNQNSAFINTRNLLNLLENGNKENFNINNEEFTKKIIKKINEMTTVKAEFKSKNEIIDINNNFFYNYYKLKDNYNSKSKKIAKNLLNMFNSCSKKLNFDGSSLNIDSKSLKKINDSSYQEIIDLFSDKSFEKNEENNNTNVVRISQNNLNLFSELSSLLESNILNNNFTNKEIIFLNSNENKSSYHLKKQISQNLENDKDNNDILIYYSPFNQKIRKFDLDSPFNGSLFSNEYTFENYPQVYGTDIKIKNFKRSQEIIEKFVKTNLHGGLLELSESPSLINTLSPKSFAKPLYRLEKIEENINLKKNEILNSSKNVIMNNEINYSINSSYRLKSEDSQNPNTIYDISFYLNLIKQSSSYPNINPNKLFKKNPSIKWEDRLEIFLWMMKNCEEFAYKRDTFHYSICYFDLFLYLSKDEIKKKDLKLIGITCISLSAKIEEVQIPKLIEYSKSIEPSCTNINIIISMEQKICSTLKWKLIPITIETWLNWYTCQWDLFIDSSPEIKKQLKEYIKEEEILFFKRQNEKAYCNYRRIYQLIDLIALDFQHYNYDKRAIVAGCFFEIICFEYDLDYLFEKKKLFSKNKKRKQKFIDIIQNMYNLFIEQSFDFLFSEQLVQNGIKYAFKFREFSFTFNMPLIYKAEQKIDQDIEYNYEDFISYQTTNSDIYSFFVKMYRGEDKYKKTESKKSLTFKNKIKSK